MKSKVNYYLLLLLIPVGFLGWYFISKKEDKPVRYLAYFGPKHALKVNDTAYHSIQDFKFSDQYGEIIDQTAVKDKIYVCEFFFTTCHSICPIMNSNMQTVYKHFKDDPDFLILSHTVDPDTDSVPVMKAYADRHGVSDHKWLFLTGNKVDLYEIARKSYLLDASEGDGGADDFIHTQNFALIDKDRHIRGYYDGTDTVEVLKMISEIELLKKEYAYKTAHSN